MKGSWSHLWASVLALGSLIAANALSPSPLATLLRTAVSAYYLIVIFLHVRTGYRRRQPHWTGESWRRYLTAAVIPFLALVGVFAMAAAVDWKLPIAGASRSPLRGVWVGAMMVLMLFAIVGITLVVSWLRDGDPARQFEWPRWLRREPSAPQ